MRIESHYIIRLLDKVAEWAIYILIFVLPFSKSLIEITIVVAFVSLLSRKVLSGERLAVFNAVNICLSIFLIASLLSVFNSKFPLLSVRAFFTKILKFVFLYIITVDIINSKKKLIKFSVISMISCFIILIDGFIQYFFTHKDILHNYPTFNYVWTDPSYLGVPTASFPFPNDFAAWILVFIFPIGAFVIFEKIKWPVKFICGVALAALLYSLFLTKVRGAWIGFAGALSAFGLVKPKTAGIILIILVTAFAFLVQGQLMHYVKSRTSVRDRAEMWDTGLRIFKAHPVIGNGVNTFFNLYKVERQDEDKGKKGSYAHNCYLQMALIPAFWSFLIYCLCDVNFLEWNKMSQKNC